jgi:hypothetical protein
VLGVERAQVSRSSASAAHPYSAASSHRAT